MIYENLLDGNVLSLMVSKWDRYLIPKIEDLFTTLAHGKTFTKLDISQAYQQVLLEEESKKYVVVNTHRGLLHYNKLPFGISSAPGIFQRVMECLLRGIPGVIVYLDDILITGSSIEEHLATLEKVFQTLEIEEKQARTLRHITRTPN